MDIPKNWEYDKKEDIVDGYYCLVDVKNPKEINEIKKTQQLGGLKIRKVQRIQNWNLYRKYQIMKAEITEAVQKYMPNAKVERRLFHGTSSNNLEAICKVGFDRDYSGTAAGLFKSNRLIIVLDARESYFILIRNEY